MINLVRFNVQHQSHASDWLRLFSGVASRDTYERTKDMDEAPPNRV